MLAGSALPPHPEAAPDPPPAPGQLRPGLLMGWVSLPVLAMPLERCLSHLRDESAPAMGVHVCTPKNAL